MSVPYPSALERLLATEPDVEVIIAERIPSGLAEAAERRGIGYLDGQGRGHVVGEGFVYVTEPVSGPVRTPRSSPFAPNASRVVRALLSDPVQHWRISDLASLVRLNPGNVHRALAALVDAGYVEREYDWYLVADPGSLLEAWAETGTPARQGHRSAIPFDGDVRDAVDGIIGRMSGHAVVSGELAAELLAPHLPAAGAIVHCLDADAWDDLAAGTLWVVKERDAVSRAGYVVVDLVDEGVAQLGSTVDGLKLVSPAQLYVDMARARGRGREAAEEVRRQRLHY